MYMDEKFGAWQVGNDENQGKVAFKIFIPDRERDPGQYEAKGAGYGDPEIERIRVVGDFQVRIGQTAWDPATAPELQRQEHPSGWQWACTTPELPAGFYEYKYYVTFKGGQTRWVSDPCCRYGGRRNQNAAVVVGGTDEEVERLPKNTRRHLRDLVQYELHIDDFTAGYRGADAPIKAVIDKLPHLQSLGVNALAILPWTAWPGEGYSWGYTPYLYFSVEQYYTEHLNASDAPAPVAVPSAERLVWLKKLISGCHRQSIQVIMDGVFNHVGCAGFDPGRDSGDGFPYPWLYRDPRNCPYLGQYGGSFATLPDLDYHNGCTQQFIRDACFYWMDEFAIDGIRFDNTTNFYLEGDAGHGLPKLLADVSGHAGPERQPFALILEHLDISAAHVVSVTAATSYWNDALHQKSSGALWDGSFDTGLIGALNTHVGLPAGKVATTYLSNHDHSHVTWRCGARDDAGSMKWYRIQPWLIALMTMPGAPLIQSGTEFGQDFWIVENDENTGRRIRFRPLQWEMAPDRIGSRLFELHKKLIALRLACPSLRSDDVYPGNEAAAWPRFTPEGYGVHVDKRVVIYHRWGTGSDGQLERFIVVLNFSDADQWVDIPFSADGRWVDQLEGSALPVTGCRCANQRIPSDWGRVYLLRGT